MNSQNLLSVVIPIYNSEKYMKNCIDSIINQTYRNIEIILVDDGSKDSSAQICDNYAKKDNRIIVIHKENNGVSSARNSGIDIAKGKYISFIDSDDYVDEFFFEKMLDLMCKMDSDLVFCDIKFVENDVEIKKINFSEKKSFSNTEMMEKMFNYNCANFAVWNKIYLTDIVKKIRFYEEILIKEDGLFCFQYLNNIKNVCYINEAMYTYIQQKNSALHVGNPEKMITSVEATDKIIEILRENNISGYADLECDLVGNYYKYKKQVLKKNKNYDLKKYKKIINNILNDENIKKVCLKNRVKVLYYKFRGVNRIKS